MNEIKIDANHIDKLLNQLVNNYKISWEVLANLFEVDERKLKNYKKYESELFEDFDHWVCWTNKALMLDFISLDSSDFRFKAYLELLVDGCKISTESIAKFAQVDESEVIRFLNGHIGEISTEIKYKISSCIMKLVIIVRI